jgi:hypothetical protein
MKRVYISGVSGLERERRDLSAVVR